MPCPLAVLRAQLGWASVLCVGWLRCRRAMRLLALREMARRCRGRRVGSGFVDFEAIDYYAAPKDFWVVSL